MNLTRKKQLLRLADSMERGIKLRPKARGELFKNGASCALGAVYEDTFGTPKNFKTVNNTGWKRLERKFSILTTRMCNIVKTGSVWIDLNNSIATKNDRLKWPRPKIVKWLRKLAS